MGLGPPGDPHLDGQAGLRHVSQRKGHLGAGGGGRGGAVSSTGRRLRASDNRDSGYIGRLAATRTLEAEGRRAPAPQKSPLGRRESHKAEQSAVTCPGPGVRGHRAPHAGCPSVALRPQSQGMLCLPGKGTHGPQNSEPCSVQAIVLETTCPSWEGRRSTRNLALGLQKGSAHPQAAAHGHRDGASAPRRGPGTPGPLPHPLVPVPPQRQEMGSIFFLLFCVEKSTGSLPQGGSGHLEFLRQIYLGLICPHTPNFQTDVSPRCRPETLAPQSVGFAGTSVLEGTLPTASENAGVCRARKAPGPPTTEEPVRFRCRVAPVAGTSFLSRLFFTLCEFHPGLRPIPRRPSLISQDAGRCTLGQ